MNMLGFIVVNIKIYVGSRNPVTKENSTNIVKIENPQMKRVFLKSFCTVVLQLEFIHPWVHPCEETVLVLDFSLFYSSIYVSRTLWGRGWGLELPSHLYYQTVFKESSVLSILNLHNAINKSSKPLLSQTKNIYVLTCIALGSHLGI